MATGLSEEDKRIMAEIKAELAEAKKRRGGAKDLAKELADAKAKRPTAKFNSKGETVAKEDAKKKPAAKKKPEAKKKVVKKPEAKKPAAKKKVVKKPEAKKKVVKKTRKPVSKLLKSLKKGSKAGSLKPSVPQTPKEKLLQSLKDSRKSPEKPASTKPEAKKTAAKKPVAKALTAESKTSTNSKIRRKKVNTSRGKPPTKTKVDVRRTGGPKFGAGNKTATAKTTPPKPKLLRGPSTLGPAGERIGGSSKTVVEKGGQRSKASTPTSKLSKLAKVGRLFSPLMAALQSEKLGEGSDIVPKDAKLFSGFKPTEDKKTAAKKTTTTSSFGAAFKKARKAGLSTFTWPADGGKSYSTATKDDVKKSGSKNLREHLNKQNKKSK